MFRNKFDARLLFDKDGGDGGGGDNEENNSPAPGTLPDAVMKSFERLMARHDNDAASVGRLLFDENRNLRETVRTLQGKVPADGAVVLASGDAQAWQAYRALGTHEEVKQSLEQRAQLQGELDGLKREAVLREVAAVAQFKPTVLAQLDRMAKAQGKELAFEVREQTVEGQVVKAAFVKEGETETPLADFATTHWGDFLPALQPAGAGSGQGGSPPSPGGAQAPAAVPGLRYPAQHPGGNGQPQTTKTIAERTLDRAYKPKPKE